MTDAAVVTFIDIRARDAASAEFKKVSQEAKRAAADVGTSFKNVAAQGVSDAVTEIRSFVRAFGLIKVGKELASIIEHFVETTRVAAEARRELDLYASYIGRSIEGTRELSDSLNQIGVSGGAANAIIQLGRGFQMTDKEIQSVSREAIVLASTVKGYAGDPARAFRDLQAASQGFYESLQKTTQLELDTQQKRIEFRQRLGADVLQRFDLQRVSSFEEQERIQAEIDRMRRDARPSAPLDPLRDEKQKRSRDDLRDAMREYNVELRNARNEERLLDEQRRIALKEQQHNVQMLEDSARQLGAAMGDAFAAIVTGAKSGKEAFAEFGREVARIISRLIAEFIALAIFRAIAGVGGNLGGAITRGVSSAGYGGGIGSPLPSGGGGGGPSALPGSFGAGINAGGGTTVNNYINTIDAKSFEAYLSQSQGHLAKLGMDSLQRDATFRRAFGAQGKVR